MSERRYRLINNSLGWLCFVIAAVTYLLTIEPTASFWDCPEFILQGYKLEIGHPPGNPIFMLASRFFINFVGNEPSNVAAAVNSMSALLSAGTILLLFWTITHLVLRLLTYGKDSRELSPLQTVITMASGICGALAYTWSDTFWFSAVEGEVYAFSSFCTALVFWLILKWENRADNPSSDKYLILIAYVIGISIAVHLLNLLCIPAIVLVIYYRKWSNITARGSLVALCISFAVVALILYGLVPGFIEISQYFELFFVNVCHLSYNTGVIIYALLLLGAFIWCIYSLYQGRKPGAMRISFMLAVLLSGMPFIGDSLWIPVLLMAALAIWLYRCPKLPTRILAVSAISILVIFIGYSSYALLLIRSTAHTPMNQNAPDNVFSLSSYLNREQYGDTPLLYGRTLNSQIVYEVQDDHTQQPVYDEGAPLYAKAVKTSESDPDRYVLTGYKRDYKMTPELNMLFPRIYSNVDEHPQAYRDWIGFKGTPVNATRYVDKNGNVLQQQMAMKPTMAENLKFFLTYQLNHMYWRYFMWNFAGRQNDIQGMGEVNHGNWISGIPFIDNARLGDQSLLPADEGRDNAGHNVFYLLPLLLGIAGLCWQAFSSKRGIEQFWVIFFLFFMTGIAIVLYLNQPPIQPRERDYAFAGSFYAYAIWIGIGVAGIWSWLSNYLTRRFKKADATLVQRITAGVAVAVALFVPLQMVSQTWDDHDRSGRYTARDFGQNYLNSLDENAIVFTHGDNDTFPLWYAQEVEGTRTDVKVINLSYLTTDWYADAVRRPTYDAPAIDMLATSADYGNDRRQYSYLVQPDSMKVEALASLRRLYDSASDRNTYGVTILDFPNMYIPVDIDSAVAAGRITADEAARAVASIPLDMRGRSGLTLAQTLSIDMLATSIENGWNRPIYFAMTVPHSLYLNLEPYMRQTGLTFEVSPLRDGTTEEIAVNTEKMYRNITERFKFGGLSAANEGHAPYLDETVRKMVTTNRSAILSLATALVNEAVGDEKLLIEGADTLSDAELVEITARRDGKYARALEVLELSDRELPVAAMPYAIPTAQQYAQLYSRLGIAMDRDDLTQRGIDILDNEIDRITGNVLYYQSLTPWQYATLQNIDKYIDAYYLLDLLRDYISTGAATGDEMIDRLEARGIDTQRLTRRAYGGQNGAE